MPYLLGDLDDRQTYHPHKLREARFSGTTYDLSRRKIDAAEFAFGLRRPTPMERLKQSSANMRKAVQNSFAAQEKTKAYKFGVKVGRAGRSIVRNVGRVANAISGKIRKSIGMAARTGLGRGIGRVATRATGIVGGVKRMRGVGNAFRSARKFSGHYLLSDRAEFSHSFSERRLSDRQRVRQLLASRLTR